MSLCQKQVESAEREQDKAAEVSSSHVRLVAGPGTGKSKVIEKRIGRLLDKPVPAKQIYVTSFTRASSLDLRKRVQTYCSEHDRMQANQIRVSTLHSLALSALRKAGQLEKYPVRPLVFDDWETTNIFDDEFRIWANYEVERCNEIRRFHEAYWSTNQEAHPSQILPDPPISDAEKSTFQRFHQSITHCYSCVLPGEIVRECVNSVCSGILDPVAIMNLKHLIVDEFQDLNPMDLNLVDLIIKHGANVFVAGDDDQSIYSFRFASPSGIQDFGNNHSNCKSHTLTRCFRCTPRVLKESHAIISRNSPPKRIKKQLVSLYETSDPKLTGVVHHWIFRSGSMEAKSVARSCRDLIAYGVKPSKMLILISNKNVLLPTLEKEFNDLGVEFESPKVADFRDSDLGRCVLALTRIVCDRDDYIAHRTLLQSFKGVGIQTCVDITKTVIDNDLNYLEMFYAPLIPSVFSSKAEKALYRARAVCEQIGDWNESDDLAMCKDIIASFIGRNFQSKESNRWNEYIERFPPQITLKELRDYLWAENRERRASILREVNTRLDIATNPDEDSSRVRMMTMHGAKGLSAQIVFIPGLEGEIFPGPHRKTRTGLVEEAARMLYVSITRARVAYIASYARTRVVHGEFRKNRPPCSFVTDFKHPFSPRCDGLTAMEIQYISDQISHL